MNNNNSPQSKSLEFGDIFNSVLAQYKANWKHLSLKYILITLINYGLAIFGGLLVALSVFGSQFGRIGDYINKSDIFNKPSYTPSGTVAGEQTKLLLDGLAEFGPSIILFILLTAVLVIVINAFTSSFLFKTTNKLARDNQVVPTVEIFKPKFSIVLNYVIAGFLNLGIVLIGLICFILPGIYLAFRLQFVYNLIVDGELTAFEAIQESFRLTGQGRVWSILLLVIIQIGLYMAYIIVFSIIFGLINSILGVNLSTPLSLINGIVFVPLFALFHSHAYVRIQNLAAADIIVE